MKSIKLIVANTQPFIGQSGVAVLGKNGFESVLGQVKPLVVDTALNSSNIVFTVSNLHLLYDDNFNCHLLEARDAPQLVSLVTKIPDNLITLSVDSKSYSNTAGKLAGSVGHQSTLSTLTANITSFDISANTISVDFNDSSVASAIKNKLLPTPFYVNLNQVINKDIPGKTYYITGDTRLINNVHSVANQSGTAILPLNIDAPNKGLISTYINDSYSKTDSLQYSYNIGEFFITHNIAASDIIIKTVVEDYSVPHIENNDSVYIYDSQQLVTINSISYSATSSTYNLELTSSDFFKITLDEELTTNIASATVINTTDDLMADIVSVDSINNIVTIEYDDSIFPYNYDLFSQRIYSVTPFSWDLFKNVEIIDNKLEVASVSGTYIFKVASVNALNRKSSPVTKSINLSNLPLGQVTNLSLSEILFKDRTKGIMSRISGVFTHIVGRNVTEYDIAYKINLLSGSTPHPSGMVDFNSFKMDTKSVGADGKVRFTLDNIDIGATGNLYEIEVRVTPLNGINIGTYNISKLQLQGKINKPEALTSFEVYQTDNTIVFEVEYPVDSQDNLNELDILHTEIKLRAPLSNINNAIDREAAFNNGDILILIPHPLTRAEVSTDKIGEGSFTFTAKTVDTSGNKSEETSARNLSISLSATIVAIAAWNEAEPNSNVVASLFNKNYGANYFASFTESDNGGFVYDIDPITTAVLGVNAPSSNAEDANASTSGFTWSLVSDDLTTANDLIITSSHASYISPVRDLGSIVKGSLSITTTIASQLSDSWVELTDDLIVGVADASPTSNILFDADFEIGSIVGYNNTDFAFSYSSTHNTIIANSVDTKIFAIINPGQEIIGEVTAREDISNVYSYALVAGAINAHAIEISGVYYANGNPVVGGNTNSLPLSNLTSSGSSYKLVDLYQFSDSVGNLIYSPVLDINKNVFVRFSSANVFATSSDSSSKPHGNVVVDLFDSTDLEGNWTQQYLGQKRFRYFQVKVDVDIPNYGETANAYIDQLYYQVSSPRKSFTTAVSSTGNILGNIFVDYSAVGFYISPSVFSQVLDDSPYLAKTNSLTNVGCNVRIIDATTGEIITDPNIEIVVSATGA